jgi:C_GCAxxG_C_C family probable redox protein
MTNHTDRLKAMAQALGDREWDIPAITARYEKLMARGVLSKKYNIKELSANRQAILDRVQKHAEEYNLLARNCPQGTALALLEEFGLGNLEVIKALCPFPGIAGTGDLCGGVTGGLIAFGLFFGSDDIRNAEADGYAIMMGQKFIAAFEHELGYLTCAEIQEHVIFGRNMDPGAGEANMEAFGKAKGFEKCGLAPGIGARLAAGIILDHLQENS